MAEVFKAKSYGVEGFEKVIAIKRILPSMGEDRDFIKMFIDEAKIAGQLTHANICQIFELGEDKGIYYLTLELVEGKDLKRMMEYHRIRNRALPLNVALLLVDCGVEAVVATPLRLDQSGDWGCHAMDTRPRKLLWG